MGANATSPFLIDETHKIALSAPSRLICHSADLGWKNVYASVAVEHPWRAELAPARHSCLAFCLSRRARIVRSIGGDRPLSGGVDMREFGVIPAGVESSWDVQGSPQMMLVYLHDSLIRTVGEEVFDADPRRIEILPRLGEADPLLEQLAMSLLEVLRAQQPQSGLYVESLAHMMAVQLLRRHAAGVLRTAPRPAAGAIKCGRMAQVEDFIEAHLDQNLSLERLAGEARLNPHYFVTAFSRAFGASPHQFVLKRRIERAKSLLRATASPLSEVALECGFSSQSHFTTTFSRLVGATPANYRRQSA